MNLKELRYITDFAYERDALIRMFDDKMLATIEHLLLIHYANTHNQSKELIPHWCSELRSFTFKFTRAKLKCGNGYNTRERAFKHVLEQSEYLDLPHWKDVYATKFAEEGFTPEDKFYDTSAPDVEKSITNLIDALSAMSVQKYNEWLNNCKTL